MWHGACYLSRGFEDHLTVRDIRFSITPWGVTAGLIELDLQLGIILTIDKLAE